jgi:exosortase/archaeosortase family protein
MKWKIFFKEGINKKQQQLLRDIALFIFATLIFHLLYWHTDMNSWLFGVWTKDIFNFFTDLAFNASKWLMSWMFSTDFITQDRVFYFYTLDSQGIQHFFSSIAIIPDCSAIKQMMQVFIFMIFVPGKIYKKVIYWVCCCVVIIIMNIVRIVGLTGVLLNFSATFKSVHDWIGRPFMYIFIFAMWVIWLEFFARPKVQPQQPQSDLQVED